MPAGKEEDYVLPLSLCIQFLQQKIWPRLKVYLKICTKSLHLPASRSRSQVWLHFWFCSSFQIKSSWQLTLAIIAPHLGNWVPASKLFKDVFHSGSSPCPSFPLPSVHLELWSFWPGSSLCLTTGKHPCLQGQMSNDRNSELKVWTQKFLFVRCFCHFGYSSRRILHWGLSLSSLLASIYLSLSLTYEEDTAHPRRSQQNSYKLFNHLLSTNTG